MNNELTRSVGTWDTVTKKGNTYFRFCRVYGNERKEFTGKTKKDVMKKIDAYESNPITRIQRATLKLPLHEYVYECCVYWATIKRVSNPKPNHAQSEVVSVYNVSKLLGHSSVATTERVYLHLLTKSNEDTSSLIDNLDID